MDILSWISLRWLVFAHVLSAVALFAVHAPSIAAMLMLRRPKHDEALRAILHMSQISTGATWAAWAALGITGALLASIEHAWRATWVWSSVIVLVLVTGSMSPLAARAFNELRGALGAAWFDGRRMQPATGIVDAASRDAALDRIRRRVPVVLTIGTLGAVVLVWLMVYKPA